MRAGIEEAATGLGDHTMSLPAPLAQELAAASEARACSRRGRPATGLLISEVAQPTFEAAIHPARCSKLRSVGEIAGE